MATTYYLDPKEQESENGLIIYENDLVMPLGKITQGNSGKLITSEKGTMFNPRNIPITPPYYRYLYVLTVRIYYPNLVVRSLPYSLT